MSLDIAYTQHLGRNPSQQDALWNSREIIQQRNVPVSGFSLDSTHAERLGVAVADGVAISPMPHKASTFVLETLASEMEQGAALDARTIRRIHGRLCDVLAKGKSFGSATTLAAVAYSMQAEDCRVISVGDSRVYRIAADGTWQPLTRDHTLLNAMIERGEADSATEYASLYNALDSCLIADDEETEFRIHSEHAPFLVGDSILLCTDGVHDILGDSGLQTLTDLGLTPHAQVELWRKAILAAGAPDNFSMILLRRSVS